MESFGRLCETLHGTIDTAAKNPTITDGLCPQCGRSSLKVVKLPSKIAYFCAGGCKADDIRAALASAGPDQTGNSPGVDETPPSLPAPSPRKSRQIEREPADRRVAPHNVDAEQSCLGAVFIERECLPRLKAILNADDFYRETHRVIFKVMDELYASGISIDALTVTEKLRARGFLEQIGGPSYLAELADACPTTLHLKDHAEIVRAMSVKRMVATLSTDLASAALNGVSAGDLVERFQRHASSLERVKENAVQDIFAAKIQPLTGRDLLRRAKEKPASRVVCDGFLYRKQVSMWAGKVEAGKTSLLRELSMCILRGDPFLGRSCVKGAVTYLMLDVDGEDLTFDEFIKMGWDPENEDGLEFIFDPIFAQKPRALDQFHSYLLERRPSLVVIDPLGRFIKADDFNAYGMTYVMAVISEMAKETDCHFAVPQHIPRGRNDDADAATAAFGSIAIGGSVNARFVCTHKPGNIYTLKTSRGKGAGFVPLDEEMILNRDETTGRITAAGAYSWKDQAKALMDQVQRLIETSDESMTAQDIASRLGIMRSAAGSAAQMLYSEKRPEYRRIDREGKGKAGSPFKFTKLLQHNLSAPNDFTPEN